MTVYSQPGIFFATDPGYLLTPGLTADPGSNQTALQNAVDALLGVGGGTIIIPSEFDNVSEYPINGPIIVGPSPNSIIFKGTGRGAGNLPALYVKNATTLFQIGSSGTPPSDSDIGGITFEDLQINYETISAEDPPTSAILATNAQNLRVLRCVFADCVNGVTLLNVLEGLVENCTFTFVSQPFGTAVTMAIDQATHNQACDQVLIKKCNIRANSTPNTYIGRGQRLQARDAGRA